MSFKLFGNCFYVSGYLRSIVYDLQNDKYEYLPNNYINENRELVSNVKVDTLVNSEMIFENDYNNYFQSMNLGYDYPSLITNAVIELDQNSKYEYILQQVLNLLCYNFQIIWKGDENILKVLNYITKSSIKHLEIVISFIEFEKIKSVINRSNFPEIQIIYVYNSPENSILNYNNENAVIIYSDKDLPNKPINVDLSHFRINTDLFIESLEYNTYYNRKLFIQLNGDIKNGPYCEKIFGNVYSGVCNLKNIINDYSFQILWRINKDKIDICKICEYRYMCVDQRIPKIKKDGEWFFEDECSYNPFLAKWNTESDYLSLKQLEISSTDEGLNINTDKLKIILNNIYSV